VLGTLRSLLNWLAGPAILLWLLPALMLLIAVGTVAQKYLGLYVAEKTFFSSFIFWAGGFLPLPGGYSLMGLLTFSLLLKFLLKSEWRRDRAGINLAHLGVLLLLAGGLVSSLMAEDGFMSIAEGSNSSQVQDYHARELMLVQKTTLLASLPQSGLQAGRILQFEGQPLTLEILSACRNCKIEAHTDSNPERRSMAKGMALSANRLDPKDEANVGGITFRISGLDDAQNGLYILFEDGPTTKLTVNGQLLELAYGKQQRSLPFQVELTDFVKTTYPGTDTAKTYHSDIRIIDGALSWPARIAMNQPLRYRGYTLYQSAFMVTPEGQEVTVLAISRDAGQFLPYLGTLVLALGLGLHIFIRGQKLRP
jgi:hypothetical protein